MRFLSFPELKPEKGIRWCRETLWRKERADPPLFVKRTLMGPSTIVYLEPCIDEYLLALAAGCDEAEATERAELLRPSMTGDAEPVKAGHEAGHGGDHAT